jgi:16S rRNA (uracil1498-N3)-methyltransferase
VNLVLFEEGEQDRPLSRGDPRAAHVLGVLGRKVGDSFDAGVIDGARGKARIIGLTDQALRLELRLTVPPAPLAPVTLLFGACRPVAAQRILREATSLGAGEIWTCGTDKAEASYLKAGLWRSGAFREHLVAGAAQAFATRIPRVRIFESLDAAVEEALRTGDAEAVALDNYEASVRLRDWAPAAGRTALLVGPERGWSARERQMMRGAGIRLAGLAERVLRTETACIAGLTLALARRGLL